MGTAKTVKEIEPTSLRDMHGREIDTAFPVRLRGERYAVEHVVGCFSPGQKHARPILVIKPLVGWQSVSVLPSEVEV